MIQTIRSNDRYEFENEWLKTKWHFSFDHYHDPANISFGPLRVFNDDVVAPGGGFPLHAHREMEIVTYIVDGALEHKDNMGNTGVIRPGEIQRMTAGTGVRHSEYNPSEKDPVHLIQLWITPAVDHLAPSWEQKTFSIADRSGKLLPIAVPIDKDGMCSVKEDGVSNPITAKGAVTIHQDATIYTSLLAPDQSVKYKLGEGRRAYIFVISGTLKLNSETLATGDQARVTSERELQLSAAMSPGTIAVDFLLLDLP